VAISLETLLTISFGVFTGAQTPYHVAMSNPGRPDSAIVGTSGSAGTLFAVDTPSTLSFPDFTCAIDDGMLSIIIVTCPPIRSVVAGPLPLYGT